jgi:hypothetical protein
VHIDTKDKVTFWMTLAFFFAFAYWKACDPSVFGMPRLGGYVEDILDYFSLFQRQTNGLPSENYLHDDGNAVKRPPHLSTRSFFVKPLCDINRDRRFRDHGAEKRLLTIILRGLRQTFFGKRDARKFSRSKGVL